MKTYDLIIIGGGRAANLANKVAKLGKKVALIEKSSLGGTYANRGCVPSKLLISYADVIRNIEESSRHYIKSNIEKIDKEKIFKENNDVRHLKEMLYIHPAISESLLPASINAIKKIESFNEKN
ncbi:MAG: FAD-dependent oxidoreductase [Halarcobacter sp.]